MSQRVVGLTAYVASLAPRGVEDAAREEATDLLYPGRVTA